MRAHSLCPGPRPRAAAATARSCRARPPPGWPAARQPARPPPPARPPTVVAVHDGVQDRARRDLEDLGLAAAPVVHLVERERLGRLAGVGLGVAHLRRRGAPTGAQPQSREGGTARERRARAAGCCSGLQAAPLPWRVRALPSLACPALLRRTMTWPARASMSTMRTRLSCRSWLLSGRQRTTTCGGAVAAGPAGVGSRAEGRRGAARARGAGRGCACSAARRGPAAAAAAAPRPAAPLSALTASVSFAMAPGWSCFVGSLRPKRDRRSRSAISARRRAKEARIAVLVGCATYWAVGGGRRGLGRGAASGGRRRGEAVRAGGRRRPVGGGRTGGAAHGPLGPPRRRAGRGRPGGRVRLLGLPCACACARCRRSWVARSPCMPRQQAARPRRPRRMRAASRCSRALDDGIMAAFFDHALTLAMERVPAAAAPPSASLRAAPCASRQCAASSSHRRGHEGRVH
jgi:hypothetical protein